MQPAFVQVAQVKRARGERPVRAVYSLFYITRVSRVSLSLGTLASRLFHTACVIIRHYALGQRRERAPVGFAVEIPADRDVDSRAMVTCNAAGLGLVARR